MMALDPRRWFKDRTRGTFATADEAAAALNMRVVSAGSLSPNEAILTSLDEPTWQRLIDLPDEERHATLGSLIRGGYVKTVKFGEEK